MKVLCVEYNEFGESTIVPVGDDVLLRNNNDFYIPEFTKNISCIPQFVVKLNKLGKCVGSRFADRYYNEFAVGVRFYADDLLDELIDKKLPPVAAYSFDGANALSVLRDFRQDAELIFYVNNIAEFTMPMSLNIDEIVSFASEYHTIKIGDFLFCGGKFRKKELKRGDNIKVQVNDEILLDFKIL